MTALIASFSTVASRQSGGIFPTTRPGFAVDPRQHRSHARLGRRHDRQPVAPVPLAEVRLDGLHRQGSDLRRQDRRGHARHHARPPPSMRARAAHRLRGPAAHALRRLTAERMVDHQERQPGSAERVRISPRARRWKAVVVISTAGVPAFASVQRVVETPRRAGPSVGGAGEDQVALLREPHEDPRAAPVSTRSPSARTRRADAAAPAGAPPCGEAGARSSPWCCRGSPP